VRYSWGMPKRSSKRRKRQKDAQQVARAVLDAVVPDAEPAKPEKAKNPAAVSLGRLGGLKGGPARAAKLTDAQKHQIAANAAAARWSNKGGSTNATE